MARYTGTTLALTACELVDMPVLVRLTTALLRGSALSGPGLHCYYHNHRCSLHHASVDNFDLTNHCHKPGILPQTSIFGIRDNVSVP
jgi:hypothetical protein